MKVKERIPEASASASKSASGTQAYSAASRGVR
jgi:hypothetical protein